VISRNPLTSLGGAPASHGGDTGSKPLGTATNLFFASFLAENGCHIRFIGGLLQQNMMLSTNVDKQMVGKGGPLRELV
jgi:hypothetical protein